MTSPADLTGRDRLAWNVAASWAAHLVFIAAGFIMPRQIDRQIGQESLGLWDFGWAAVNYFYLAQIGVGVSVNRYVARYRAAHDVEGLRRTVSSVMLLQIAAAFIVLAATAASALWLPELFRGRLGGEIVIARWVIAMLGASVAVRMAFQAFNGVVTGCHRWDLHSLLNSSGYAMTAAAMLVALSFGGGLTTISVVYLCGTIVTELARTALAFHVCPELRVSLRRAQWAEARALLAFGAKLSSLDAATIVTSQLTSMLVLGQIGIATLAVYSRLCALIRHTENIAAKYSLTLTPMASSLEGSGRSNEVGDLVVQGTRFTAYLVWPILLGLAFVGDGVLELWMGPRYDADLVLALMATGSLFPLSQQPLYPILVGLNLHGRFAAINIVASIVALAGSLVALRWFHVGLLGLAGVGLLVSNLAAMCIAVDTCRRLSMSARRYFVDVYAGPLACAIPFAIGLLLVRLAFNDRPVLLLEMACAVGLVVLVPLYWRRVLTMPMRQMIMKGFIDRVAAFRLGFEGGS